jgi:putative acetyltransferase
MWDDGGDALLAVGALKRLSPDHGEVKSMHTAEPARRKGAGSAMLRHIIGAARASGLSRLSLETGASGYFHPARELYKRHGFAECPPFGDYAPDPNSVFLSLELRGSRP